MWLPWKPKTASRPDPGAPKTVPLVVGLGNPGETYRLTRHNIGFRVVDRLCEQYRLRIFSDCRVQAELAHGMIAGKAVMTVKPLAFMNLSGVPVAAVSRFYEIQCEDMIIVHDDIDLAYGRLKIKEKGGDGGHNGLRSLTDALGSSAFTRIRVGVGRPCAGVSVIDHVLGEFDPNPQPSLDHFLSQAVEVVAAILCQGAREAMNRFNRKT